jgi:hypothetical protein
MTTGQDDAMRSLARFLIAAACIGGLVAIALILGDSDGARTSSRALSTAVALAFFSLTGGAGLRLAGSRDELLSSSFGYLTAAVSLLAFGEVVAAFWSSDVLSGSNWKVAAETTLLAFGAGNVSLLLGSERAEDGDAVRLVRIATVGAAVLLTALALIEISSPGPDVDRKLLGVAAVAYLLGAVLLPLLRWEAGRD